MIIDLLATIFGEVPVPRPASGAVPSRRIEWLFGDVEAPSIMRLYDDPTIDTPVGLSLLAMPRASRADAAPGIGAQGQKPTRFQIACMTLPYARFPLQRALEGIAASGYKYVAWGTTHNETSGERVPVMAPDAKPAAVSPT